ncbi:glycosyltransferase [Chloroflexota bacterium]
MIARRLRIIVGGFLACWPLGGVTWDYAQYLIGLQRLGHDVYYYENHGMTPIPPLKYPDFPDGTYSAKYIANFFERYAPELCDRWHYNHLRQTSFGMDEAEFGEIARSADVFLNVSGASSMPEYLSSRCVKVYLDSDPGLNQILLSENFPWKVNQERWKSTVRSYDQFFTYAENIHNTDCIVPTVGINWKTTRMPVVLPLWELFSHFHPPEGSPWTTIMTWDSYRDGALIYKGVTYGSKVPEFERLIDLPRNTDASLMIALGGKAPVKELEDHGWLVLHGPSATLTPGQYQEYIAASRGEIAPAKNVYVAMRTGWFSCRSACYLAAGRPVIVQDTSFPNIIPSGQGILPFRSMEEAAASIDEAETNYERHAKAARAIAEEYFDSNKVLTNLIESAME